jgi:hypothetical protein
MRKKTRAALTLAASATLGAGIALASAVPASADGFLQPLFGETTIAAGDSKEVRHSLNFRDVQGAPITATKLTNTITAPAGITFAGPATITSEQGGGAQSCTLVGSQRIDCTWTGSHTWAVGSAQTFDWITTTYTAVVGADTAPGKYRISYTGLLTRTDGTWVLPNPSPSHDIIVPQTVDTPVFTAGAAVGAVAIAGIAGVIAYRRRRASATASATHEG